MEIRTIFGPNLTELRPSFVQFSGDLARFQKNSEVIWISAELLLKFSKLGNNSAEIHMTSELCPNFAETWIPTELYKTRAQFSQIRTEYSPNLHCIIRFRLVHVTMCLPWAIQTLERNNMDSLKRKLQVIFKLDYYNIVMLVIVYLINKLFFQFAKLYNLQ